MGRLFTYMVKAAAGEQPTPYTGSYGTWGNSDMSRPLSGVYELPFFWAGSVRDRNKAIDRLFSASQNVDSWQALADKHGNNWGANYLTAIDSRFTSPEAVYDALSANRDYLEAIRHFANTGSYDKLDKLTSFYNRYNPNYVGSGYVRYKNGFDVHNGTDYDLADGVGNAQLVINTYLAEQARRKKAAEEAAKAELESEGYKGGDPDGSIMDAYRSMVPSSAAAATTGQPTDPRPSTPVQAPAIPEGTYVVTGPDGKKYISSNDDSKAQTAAGIGAALKAGRNPFAGALTTAPGASGPTRVNMNAAQDAVRNKMNSNISSGRSMYSNMGAASRFMTEAQRHAMDAARPYEDSGLRMVGHSADGRTRTYVGRSGRGRITVGDNAQAGHYRGVGAVDTNTRSNYADLRQPTATRSVTPSTVSPVRKSPTTSRR